jgi:uncharacterized protein YbbC (DUF1343 family)
MIVFGIDRLLRHRGLFRGRRVGLITNPSGVNREFRPTADIMREQTDLRVLFSPEHGADGDRQAGVPVAGRLNPRLRLPEHSLFGEGARLTPEMLAEVDLLAYDIQDIGSRYYTYLYTLSDAMAACARAGVPVVVLDRPNPLGGSRAEGTLLREDFASAVGRFPLPARTGLTTGEFATFVNRRFRIGCELTVVRCGGWRRRCFFAGIGRSWLNPSPNMPSLTAALLYNGTCLIEGTNISEGRGTTRPFELIGAPFLDGPLVAARLNARRLPGVVFRPCVFTPVAGKFAGEACRGLQVHVTGPRLVNGFEVGIHLLDVIRETTPELTFNAHFDRLFGDDVLRLGKESPAAVMARGRAESAAFLRETGPFRLYR